MHKYTYGWLPDLFDSRDHLYTSPAHFRNNLPASVDLRGSCPPVYDQGELGSCTANALAAALEFDQMKLGRPAVTPSRLFIYYNERAMEHTVSEDSGARIRDGIKSAHKQGCCPESEWPYDIARFTEKPPAQCYTDARTHLVTSYKRIAHSLSQMQSCLASGYPFVLGFSVYSSFESDEVAETGIAPMPAANEELLGGHAVLAVGYDNATQRFLLRNSWSAGWGMQGYFTLPYQYLLSPDLSADFWTVNAVE